MSMKKYKSDLFMIDTPLDGLEEGKERLSKGTKKGILIYLWDDANQVRPSLQKI